MKVAIYCRLSEEDRNKQSETDDSNSIQNHDVICEGGFHLRNTSRLCPFAATGLSLKERANAELPS